MEEEEEGVARTRVAAAGHAVRHRGVFGTTGVEVPRLLLPQLPPPVTRTYINGNHLVSRV